MKLEKIYEKDNELIESKEQVEFNNFYKNFFDIENIGEKNCEKLSEEFFDVIPLQRKKSVENAYENTETLVLELIEKYKENLEVGYANINESCHYYRNKIYMQRNLDCLEYGEIFRHEMGHYLDEQQGWYSEQLQYINAVYDDTILYEGGMLKRNEALDEMLDELFSSDVCYNKYVSDVISATTKNNPKVIMRYAMEGVPYYRHKNSYFEQSKNRENEIYADIIACICENNEETLGFLEKYFPNSYKATTRSIEEN